MGAGSPSRGLAMDRRGRDGMDIDGWTRDLTARVQCRVPTVRPLIRPSPLGPHQDPRVGGRGRCGTCPVALDQDVGMTAMPGEAVNDIGGHATRPLLALFARRA